MSGSGYEQGEDPQQRAPESADRPAWRPTVSRQPGRVQRSDDPAPTARPDSATSEFGNPGGLWLG